ncbi:agmatinase [Pseudoxanthomonas kalamensis DSM 18571]|uniref:agmatinase n=1 Tax=Pseudoxanthomonas kalamensis TaxID=289483 RepID=UPI001390A50E|nr:agmatinase [Pseudoxanthomonas kalamensis]KAF1709346.1 agmatinase [Pseudoxanthomonas kalamensis DSM 18571]
MNHDPDAAFDSGSIDQAFTRPSPYGTRAEPAYSGALSFLRRRYSKSLQDVDVAVVGVPLDLATTYRPGARLGPRAIRAASVSLAWCAPYAWDFDPCERLHVIDWGDVLFDHGRPERIVDAIATIFAEFVRHGVVPLALGGDHFISYPILRALSAAHGPLSLIHFDAHSDTWRDESGRIDHGTMFFHAAREGLVDPARSIQVGMRTLNPEDHGFQVLDARWLHEHGTAACIERIRQRIGDHPCYVSFDIDFLDPSCAPGTGTPVIGGFGTHQALQLIRGLAGLNMVGMDVVEVAPAYDHAEITALAAASIAQELLAAHASRFGGRA